jgi:LPXTG-motif cell wall-anchored protein
VSQQECGIKPDKPTPQVDTRETVLPVDCTNLVQVTEHQSRTQTVTWNEDDWTWDVAWGDWVTNSTSQRTVSQRECGIQPDRPAPIVSTGHSSDVDCQAFTVVDHNWRSTTDWTFDQDSYTWVKDEPVIERWDSHRSPTAQECPAGEKPQPEVTQNEKSDVDCSSAVRTVTTTTTTTDWVLNDAKTEWVKGAPKVTTAVASYETTAQECPSATTPPTVGGVKVTAPPTPPVITPVVEGVKHSAAAPALAYTGSEAGLYGAAGALLLFLGAGLVVFSRRRTREG